jgi:hypothetical protein
MERETLLLEEAGGREVLIAELDNIIWGGGAGV